MLTPSASALTSARPSPGRSSAPAMLRSAVSRMSTTLGRTPVCRQAASWVDKAALGVITTYSCLGRDGSCCSVGMAIQARLTSSSRLPSSVLSDQRRLASISRGGTAGSAITRSRYCVRARVISTDSRRSTPAISARSARGSGSAVALGCTETASTCGRSPARTEVFRLIAHSDGPPPLSIAVHPLGLKPMSICSALYGPARAQGPAKCVGER